MMKEYTFAYGRGSKTFSLDLLVGVLPVLVVYGLIRGRAFCVSSSVRICFVTVSN